MNIVLNGLALPAMLWPDEFNAQQVAQTSKRTLAGGIVVFHNQLTAGQSITLESSEKAGWLRRSQVQALKAMADQSGLVMSLSLRGQSYSVTFRHHEGNAFEAEPVFPYANPTADDYYIASIRLMTV